MGAFAYVIWANSPISNWEWADKHRLNMNIFQGVRDRKTAAALALAYYDSTRPFAMNKDA